MTKRNTILGLMKFAGYHLDRATFTQLLIENRISRAAADEAFRAGIRAKQNGMRCGCSDCAPR